jgi:hypothetical protein
MIGLDNRGPRDAPTPGGMAPDTGRYPMHEGSYGEDDSRFEARLGLYAMSVADAVEARLATRGSTIDGGYLVEIGCARLELGAFDGEIRRGEPCEARVARQRLARYDDLFRRIESAIVRNAPIVEAA